MPTQVLQPDATASPAPQMPSSAIVEQALRKPYAAPIVSSFELDPHDVDSGDALTANG